MTTGYRGNGVGGQIATSAQIQNGVVDYPKLSSALVAILGMGGSRNLLLNPLFSVVNQRAYAGAAVGAANQYTWDRWRVVVSGQTAPVSGFTLTAPAGGIEQVVEGVNIPFAATYTLGWLGTATVTVNGTPVGNGATFALPANTNAVVRFTGGTVLCPQLLLGTVLTSFDARMAPLESLLCQRYYAADSTAVLLACYAAGYGCASPVFLPTQMRAAPTVLASPAAFYSVGFTAQYAINTTPKHFMYYFTSPGAVGTAGSGTLNWSANAEL